MNGSDEEALPRVEVTLEPDVSASEDALVMGKEDI